MLNGADVFALELSKGAQATLLATLGIDTPRSITFNEVNALRAFGGALQWPALLKPDQGGSGARIQVVDSLDQIEEIFRIVRLKFLGGEVPADAVRTATRFVQAYS